MKILYSCLSKSWGGMEMVTLTGIKQLLKNNIKVELLCADDSRLQLEANNFGIIIHPLNSINTVNPFSILKTASIIKSGNFDLIHSHASRDLWLLVPALKILRKSLPLVLTKHVGSFIIKKDFLHNKIYNRVTLAIAISEVIKKNLITTTSVTEEKIKIIYNGVDLTKFDPSVADRNKLRNELNVGINDILIGMTGRFSLGKGHEEFLFTAKELNKKYSNLKFVIVGEASRGEDNYATKIQLLTKEYNLQNVFFVGFRSDIPDVLAAMDIFVFPSHAEAFGVGLIEAMSMNKPTVAANTDGVLDIVLDNETGLFFNSRDGKDLCDKIEKLIDNSELRLKLGTNARKRVREIFDLEKITDQHIITYNNLINKSNGSIN
jgi:glycosyltransferase involved in cell wall biosynthesis